MRHYVNSLSWSIKATERLYRIGNEHRTVLDSNVVNQIVVGLSFGKQSQDLMPNWLLDLLPETVYTVGACEAYLQRTKVQKKQALKTCVAVFSGFGCQKPEKDEWEMIFKSHLSSYLVVLLLLSTRPNWQYFMKWIYDYRVPVSSETFWFAESSINNSHKFPLQRLTHLSGNDNADHIASAAWNVAWDLTLLEYAKTMHRCVITHDAALSDWCEYKKQNSKKASDISGDADIPNLVHILEIQMGVTAAFDANLSYKGGVWPLLIRSEG